METKQHKDKMNVGELEMFMCDLVFCIHSGLFMVAIIKK